MLYTWLYSLSEYASAFNVFRYITFRTFLSFLTAFLICWLFGPKFINRLVRKQMGQNVRDDGPQSHKAKQGTPTMGGGLILIGVLAPVFMWIDVGNPLVLGCLLITLTFGLVGYADDYMKVSKKNSKGLSGKLRLLMEFSISVLVVGSLLYVGAINSEVHLPFFKGIALDLHWGYVAFASLVIVGCANAVNLTDGLDGLAIAPVIISSGTYGIFAYIAGHREIALYLQIPFIPGAG